MTHNNQPPEFPGRFSFEIFEWSKAGQTYDTTNSRDTWKAIKVDGGVTAGTLFHLARLAGLKHTGITLDSIVPAKMEIPRGRVRAALAMLTVTGRIRDEELPRDERKKGLPQPRQARRRG